MRNNFQASYGIVCPMWVGVGAASLIIGSQGTGTKLAVALGAVAIEHGCDVRRKKCKREVSNGHTFHFETYT